MDKWPVKSRIELAKTDKLGYFFVAPTNADKRIRYQLRFPISFLGVNAWVLKG